MQLEQITDGTGEKNAAKMTSEDVSTDIQRNHLLNHQILSRYQ